MFLGTLVALTLTASPGQQPQELKRSVPVEMKYLLFLPRDYQAKPETKWPLIVFLHGSGGRGDDLDAVKKHGPPKLAAAKPDFPFIVASPQCPKDRFWEPSKVVALVDELVE